MKRRTSKAMCLLCAVLMSATALTACGGSDDSKKDAKKDGDKATTVSENLNKEGLPILKEKETFDVYIAQMSSKKAANDKKCSVDAVAATNVDINWIEIPTASWTEKTNILFASDSLPDAFCGDVDIAAYGEQLLDLDDLINEYAPVTKALFTERKDYPQALSDTNGKIKTLPIGDEYIGNTLDSQTWVNQDWLTRLNLQMPTTTEEFETVLRAFKDQDANGNGDPNDEIPYTFTNVWGWATGLENMFGPFGVVENASHVFLSPKDNKTVVFSAEEQGYYDFLEWMHKLYADGLIDTECFTQSSDQYYTKNSGKDIIGACQEYNDGGLGTPISDSNPEERKFKHCKVLKGPKGDQYTGLNNLTRTSGIEITKNCKNPEALMRWYDWANTDIETYESFRRGIEGETWVKLTDDPDGKKVMEKLMKEPDYKKLGFENAADYYSANGFAGWCPVLKYDKKLEVVKFEDPIERKRDAAQIDIEFGLKPLPNGVATAENTDKRSVLKADIDNYLLRFISESITNGIDKAKWDEHKEQLKKLRVDEYKTLCQEFVDAVQSR